MFSYQKIVFGIKHCYRISDVLDIIKESRTYSFFIREHNALNADDYCNRPGVHYHGIVEINEGKVGNILMLLLPYCRYVKVDNCNSPVEYLAYIITLEPRQTYQEILNPSKLKEFLQTATSKNLEFMDRKKNRQFSLLVHNDMVVKLMTILLSSGRSVCNEIIKRKNKDIPGEIIQKLCGVRSVSDEIVFTPKITEAALSVSQKIVLNKSISDLCGDFDLKNEYLSPVESAQYVSDWCAFQNLDPQMFAKNLIRCLDKKGGNRHSIYLHGSRDSGKSYIIESIIDACIYVGDIMVESSAYPFVWEKCVDKRLIVLKEPHFSTVNFDQLDKILSGSGTLIYKHNDLVDYLQPTPVIILANDNDWMNDSQLNEKIKKRFLCCYMDLKQFSKRSKRLHPRWLNILAKKSSSRKGSKGERKDSKISYERQLQPNQVANKGRHIINGESSHSLKSNGDSDLFRNSPVNSKHEDENAMQPNMQYKKRSIRETTNDTGRNKVGQLDVSLEKSEREAASFHEKENAEHMEGYEQMDWEPVHPLSD